MNWKRNVVGFITFIVFACLLSALSSCGSDPYADESEYAEVCVSQHSGTRVDDVMCDTHNGLPPQPWFVYYWYPVHYYSVPPVGGIAPTGYVTTRPTNVTVKRATPRGNAAPLPYSEAEKKKRRDALAKQQDTWYKKQQQTAKKNNWNPVPKQNGGAYKPSTTTTGGYKPPARTTTTSRPR